MCLVWHLYNSMRKFFFFQFCVCIPFKPACMEGRMEHNEKCFCVLRRLQKAWTPTIGQRETFAHYWAASVCLQVRALSIKLAHRHTYGMATSSPKWLPCVEGSSHRGCSIRLSLTGPKAASPLNTHESLIRAPLCATGLEAGVIGERLSQDPDTQRKHSAH